MKKLNELIIFFLDVLYSLKNIHFLRLSEELQNEELKEHIKAVRQLINSHLDNLIKELENDTNDLEDIEI